MRPIIVEGLDNTGKTTLIEKLSQTLGLDVILSCRSIPLEQQLEWIQKQVDSEFAYIYDRFTLISEHVYGPILRGGSKFDNMEDDNWIDLVAKTFGAMKPIVIYCRPPINVIKASFHEREQMGGVNEHLDSLIERYDHTMTNIESITNTGIMLYDWTTDPAANILLATVYNKMYKQPSPNWRTRVLNNFNRGCV